MNKTYADCASAPKQPDTMPMLIEEIGKLAYSLNTQAGMVADNLSGAVPTETGCDKIAPSTIMERLREIRITLASAQNNQQRILTTLAL